VRIALGLQGIDYEYVAVHLVRDGGEQRTEAYERDHNPMRQVPVLEWTENGPQRLTQSLAILEMLSERGPTSLLPEAPLARAKARELAEVVNSGIQPQQNLATLQMVESLGGDKRAHGQAVIARGLASMERLATTAGTFLVGDEVSLADLCLVPQLYNAERFGLALNAFPTLVRAAAACAERPAFIAAHPDRQPDCPEQD
jgi:maleylpyruvate isomerase